MPGTRPRVVASPANFDSVDAVRLPAIKHVCSFLLVLYACSTIVRSQQTCDEGMVLQPGTSLSCKSDGGQTHSFKLSVPANSFVHLIVRQRKIILTAIVRDSESHELVNTSFPAGGDGPIEISAIAATAGDYRLEVHSVENWAVPGSFDVVVEQPRSTVPDDALRIAAERAFAKGLQQDQAGAFAAAIEEFNKALLYWKSVNDTHW